MARDAIEESSRVMYALRKLQKSLQPQPEKKSNKSYALSLSDGCRPVLLEPATRTHAHTCPRQPSPVDFSCGVAFGVAGRASEGHFDLPRDAAGPDLPLVKTTTEDGPATGPVPALPTDSLLAQLRSRTQRLQAGGHAQAPRCHGGGMDVKQQLQARVARIKQGVVGRGINPQRGARVSPSLRWLPRTIHGLSLPRLAESDAESLEALARALARAAERAEDKAELAYKWVACNIAYDVETFKGAAISASSPARSTQTTRGAEAANLLHSCLNSLAWCSGRKRASQQAPAVLCADSSRYHSD
jgi:hypothetical protein